MQSSVPGGGQCRQPLCWGLLQHRRRRRGQPHRQVGRQRLVCSGQRDKWQTSPCAGGGRRRQSICRGLLQYRRRHRRQTTSRSGTATPGLPWAADWAETITTMSLRGGWRQQPLRWRRLQCRWRRGSEPHRQVERQRLVCLGQRDKWHRRCPGGGRRRQPLRRGPNHHRRGQAIGKSSHIGSPPMR